MKRIDLDIPTLRSFVAVAETRGFTSASEQLHRTQSAITMKIKKLEETLGKKVFERTSRSLILTPEGEILLSYAYRILSLNDETVRRMINPDIHGEIRLGVADYVIPNHLPHLIKRFRLQYPNIHLVVTTGPSKELDQQLADGLLDSVIASCNEANESNQILASEPLVWVCAKTFVVDLGAPIPLALMPPPCQYRTEALKGLKSKELSWDLIFTSSSVAGIQAAVSAGIVTTVLTRSSILPGMRILGINDGFPSLKDIHFGVYGGVVLDKPHIRPFIQFIKEEMSCMF